MKIQELRKMSVDELRKLNSSIIEVLNEKKRIEAIEKRTILKIGEIVTVKHEKMEGKKFIVEKINVTKAILKSKDGLNRLFNVPIVLINKK